MSPRAAWRLEQLGVRDVYDYVAGKMDWLGHGLPYEGSADLVGRHLDEAATCEPDQQTSAVADRLGDVSDGCVVVADGIVVGLLSGRTLEKRPDVRVAEAMDTGVTTVRPSADRPDLNRRMEDHGVARIVVTDPGARLLGFYRRQPTRGTVAP